jgi:hypothetical protein
MVLAIIIDLAWTSGLIFWLILNKMLKEKNRSNESHYKVTLLLVSRIKL